MLTHIHMCGQQEHTESVWRPGSGWEGHPKRDTGWTSGWAQHIPRAPCRRSSVSTPIVPCLTCFRYFYCPCQDRTKARLRTKTFLWISPVLDAARAMSLLLDSRRPKNCEMRSKPADSENDEAGKQTKETQRQPLAMVLREEKRL